MKILIYNYSLISTTRGDFCGRYTTDGICTKDTEVECLEIIKSDNNPLDRRDMIIIEDLNIMDGGEYLKIMPGSYEVL